MNTPLKLWSILGLFALVNLCACTDSNSNAGSQSSSLRNHSSQTDTDAESTGSRPGYGLSKERQSRKTKTAKSSNQSERPDLSKMKTVRLKNSGVTLYIPRQKGAEETDKDDEAASKNRDDQANPKPASDPIFEHGKTHPVPADNAEVPAVQ